MIDWEVERFVNPFKEAGYTISYVQNKDKYLEFLKVLGRNEVLVFIQGNMSIAVFLSDTGADYVTFPIRDGKIRRRDD